MQRSIEHDRRPFSQDDPRALVLVECDADAIAVWSEAGALFEPRIEVVQLAGESREAATSRLRPELVVVQGRESGEDVPVGVLYTTRPLEFLSPPHVPEVAIALLRELGRLGRAHVRVRPLPPDPRAHLLIVDDEVACLRSTHRHLRRIRPELRFSFAMNGREALAAIRAHRPDVVMTNLNMPIMGGYELLKAIREDEALASLPVIVASGGAYRRYDPPLESWRPDFVLLKPVALEELRTTVLGCLNRAPGIVHALPPRGSA